MFTHPQKPVSNLICRIAEIFYKKVGKRYKPVSAHSVEVMDSFPLGSHLYHSIGEAVEAVEAFGAELVKTVSVK